ncbi:rRNA pseudouridine synthase [Staphylococcus felis]|uniref:pseudouridine synthase n=1 Tax=Staphylococcus felis TaxID=46127 RepID=UPI000CD14D1C|nr:pseudouridine synthase [Staphylococcus felis]AVP37337.1 rRNA pseudouridine synthase [Staphylococcus felis]PNZ36621.1 16S rRNA pseudouridine(516) synthase [Staphylococcus felis]QQB02714.1 rRNA pseudouridine synthase [Staphylococcus felis]REH75760.1 rRNA pseudouridine synthase [Staphylococcus felis]REH93383.1 rRNA pseudouridine synthase [Staphylococcus felis]
MRIDKFLAQMGYGSRNEIKNSIKKGHVSINGNKIKSAKSHIDPNQDMVYFMNERVQYEPYVYIMMNKPQGVISATEDDVHQTVIDLITEYRHLHLFPVGRLDKDTEGLLLITNDGQFNHRIMNPNQKVPKTYYVQAKHDLVEQNRAYFQEGVQLKDSICKPASLEILTNPKEALVKIEEGKYHQIKRMFHKIDNEVLFLKRIAIGSLQLDDNLKPGTYRKLTPEELQLFL